MGDENKKEWGSDILLMTEWSLEHRSGRIEIENREKMIKQHLKEREKKFKQPEVTKEEEQKRIAFLREQGIQI
jgi:hypothetical protein